MEIKIRSYNTSYCLIEVVTKAGLTVCLPPCSYRVNSGSCGHFAKCNVMQHVNVDRAQIVHLILSSFKNKLKVPIYFLPM